MGAGCSELTSAALRGWFRFTGTGTGHAGPSEPGTSAIRGHPEKLARIHNGTAQQEVRAISVARCLATQPKRRNGRTTGIVMGCEEGTLTRPGAPPGVGRILIATGIGYALIVIDANAIFVAVNPMSVDFGTDLDGMHWILTAQFIAIAALTIPFGALSDRFGARRTFIGGLIWFAATSALSGASQNVLSMVACRLVQGVGAAAIVSSAVAYLAVAYGDHQGRPSAVATWTAVTAVVASLGAGLGGLLTAISWRLIFYVNVPLSIVCLTLLLGLPSQVAPRTGAKQDAVWQVFAAVMMFGLVGGIIEGAGPTGLEPHAYVLFGIGICGFVGLAFRISTTPQLSPIRNLLRTPGYRTGLAAGLFVNFVIYGLPSVISLYLATTLNWNAALVGAALLPLGITSAIIRVSTGPLMRRFGAQRLIVFGGVITAVSFATLALIEGTPPYLPPILGVLIGCGFGAAVVIPASSAVVVQSTDQALQGTGSGVLNAGRQASIALGIAVFGGIVDALGSVGGAFLYMGIIGVVLAIGTCLYTVRKGALDGSHGLRRDEPVAD